MRIKMFIKKTVLMGLVLTGVSLQAEAQLFEKLRLYPNVALIKSKIYDSSGKSRFWSIERLDSLGRLTEKEDYYKKTLLSKAKLTYDSRNNKLLDIRTYSISDSNHVDTIRYDYEYTKDGISYPKQVRSSRKDSIVVTLVDNIGDTTFIYQSVHYNPKTKPDSICCYKEMRFLTFRDGLLVKDKRLDLQDKSEETTSYEYFTNGKLKRRVIEREPKSKFDGIYIGGPGSNDMSFDYVLDKAGRPTKSYTTTRGKRYKQVTYKYYFRR